MSSSSPDPDPAAVRLPERLKAMFPGASLEPDDMYLLESFQISYLPGWIPEAHLAVMLREHPGIEDFLRKKHPPVAVFLDRIMRENPPSTPVSDIRTAEQTALWTIADLLVYSKCPEVYDSLEFHEWDFSLVTDIASLEGKTVIDAGAGTGRVAFEAALHARTVFAVEPVTRLRDFMREKALTLGRKNVHVCDGFLHRLPFPDDFAQVLITSHALAWDLPNELPEMERVVAPGGCLIHCPGTSLAEGDSETHLTLLSRGYEWSVQSESDGDKRRYWKHMPLNSCARMDTGV